MEKVTTLPSFAALNSGRQELLDLAGDGVLELVDFSGPTPGFVERSDEEGWKRFVPFQSQPNLPWEDRNLRFVDLTGDGHADILISDNEAFTWYPSLAEAGFGQGEKVCHPLDEEKGPRLVFADGTDSIYLADMSGDGLTDLVRIRNGEVSFWPNLGYGRFGAKVTMDDAPWFDTPDRFDQRRIRVADIDGSGVTDIIYLGSDGVHVYFNLSGNRWSEPHHLLHFPRVDDLASITVVDLFGNGTACIVWSSPLPGSARRPMRYIDLMGGQKPHLLIGVKNNLGAETKVQYASSTKFYLKDKAAGKPWLTKLPFPVHVVERVEIYDRISRNRFVTRSEYHHGYYDDVEREFRGFAMVEQWDTDEFAALNESSELVGGENIDPASHVPPVLTRTWIHTGAYLDGIHISRQLDDEYYREGDASLGESGLSEAEQQSMLLADTKLPKDLLLSGGNRRSWTISLEEERQAARALKGSLLRQEIYATDGTEAQDRPYSVAERNYTIELLQPLGTNHHAVLLAHSHETIDFHYERQLYDINGKKRADPRVAHALTLAVDEFGNVLQSAAIGYGCRKGHFDPLFDVEDRNKQKRTLITLTESVYTKPVLHEDVYRLGLPCETKTYELRGLTPSSSAAAVTNLFRFEEIEGKVRELSDGLHDIPYESPAATGVVTPQPSRRLIENVRTLFRNDDLSGPMPLGQMGSLALPFESYQLSFSPGLLKQVYEARVTDAMLETQGRYVHGEGDLDWWVRSGEIFYSPGKNDLFAQESLKPPSRSHC